MSIRGSDEPITGCFSRKCTCWVVVGVGRVCFMNNELIVVREPITIRISGVFGESSTDALIAIHGKGERIICSSACTRPGSEEVP